MYLTFHHVCTTRTASTEREKCLFMFILFRVVACVRVCGRLNINVRDEKVQACGIRLRGCECCESRKSKKKTRIKIGQINIKSKRDEIFNNFTFF